MTADYDAALVIGISHYPSLRPLQGPVGDATRFADWLRGTGGLPAVNVELVVSDNIEPGRPILSEIDEAFDRIFNRARAWPEPRRLYVYFAGHGCSKAIDHLALLMANADLDRLNRAMNATEYREALSYRAFPEQIYLFDCCRNYDSTVTGRGPEWTAINPDVSPPLTGLVQVVMYAAGFTEFANERNLIYSERRGLFTKVLLEGLAGAAAQHDLVSGQGIVTTDRLIPYVRDRLDELTRQENVRQHLWPVRLGARPLVLATGITPRHRTLQVDLPPGTTRLVMQPEQGGTGVDMEVPPGQTQVQVDLEMTVYNVAAQPSGVQETIRILPTTPASLDLGGSRDAAVVG
jgi:hypothetical protein